jgi:hypothetical protein
MVQVVDCLPSKCKALDWNPSTITTSKNSLLVLQCLYHYYFHPHLWVRGYIANQKDHQCTSQRKKWREFKESSFLSNVKEFILKNWMIVLHTFPICDTKAPNTALSQSDLLVFTPFCSLFSWILISSMTHLWQIEYYGSDNAWLPSLG